MKKLLALLLAVYMVALVGLIVEFNLFGVNAPKNEVLASVGDYKEIAFYRDAGFQDFIEYGKYRVENPNFGENPYLKQITSASRKKLIEIIDNFEGWLETSKGDGDNEVTINYDFDRSLISGSDFLYIDDLYNGTWWYYDVYFFDCETNTIYRFRINI